MPGACITALAFQTNEAVPGPREIGAGRWIFISGEDAR